jgi:hypothetical protein
MTAPLEGFVQHRYGGIYRVLSTGKSTIDASEVVIYTHVWPFEFGTWVRPMSEWTEDRFKPLTENEVIVLRQADREKACAAITAAKAASKKPVIEVTDNCPQCGALWVDHDFGVPQPFCP